MSSGPAHVQSGEGPTFPALLRNRAEEDPTGTAYVEKRLGIWRPVSWATYADQVSVLAHGLCSLGVVEGDGVAIMARPCSEWFVLDLAAQSIGAVSIGLYVTTPADELRRIVSAVKPKVLVLENDEYIDRFADGGDGSDGPSIVRLTGSARAGQSFADLEADGRAKQTDDPDGWDRWVDARAADEPVIGLVSSGTTQPARVAVHAPRGVMDAWRSVADASKMGASRRRQRTVADAQLAHPVARSLAVYLPLITGSVTYVPDTEEAAASAAVEVRPTLAYVSPSRLSALGSRIDTALDRSGRFRQAVVRVASRLRQTTVTRQSESARVRAGMTSAVGYVIACRQILDRFGMVAVRVAFAGGSQVDSRLLHRWRLLGLPVRRIYSLAEAGVGGFETGHGGLDGWLTTPSNVEVRIAPSGELELTGSGVCLGFYESGAVRAASSWTGTGDIALLDADGRIRFVDRLANAVTVGDHTIYRAHIESLFADAAHVRNVHVFEGRPGRLAALIELDIELVNMWAADAGRHVTTLAELAGDPEVHELVSGHVDRVNERLGAEGLLRIDDFRVLPTELHPEDGHAMTPNGDLRRAAVEVQFGDLITELRGSPSQVHDRQQAAHGLR